MRPVAFSAGPPATNWQRRVLFPMFAGVGDSIRLRSPEFLWKEKRGRIRILLCFLPLIKPSTSGKEEIEIDL